MAIKTIRGKVVEHKMFFNRQEEEYVQVEAVDFKPDVCGFYYMKAVNPSKPTQNWRRSWEELEIIKVADGLYHLKFYAVSSPRFNIRTDAFLVLEMTKEEIIDWHESDVWFEKGYHYIIRRAGKKFYQRGDQKRCFTCEYLVAPKATKCDNPNCKESQ